MSDNVTLTTGSVSPPSGTIVAADEITIDGTTAKVQRVKLVHGAAGSGVDASATNPVPVTDLMVPLTSATPVAVASSASAVTLQASNPARRALLIFNDSTAALYVKYGSAASSSSYTVKLAAGDYWEMPLPAYTGVVTGVWASANGNALVTEGV